MQDHLVFERVENVPMDGQASRLSSGDACCLRDGACASRLATLVRDGLFPLCIIMAILALDYVMRK